LLKYARIVTDALSQRMLAISTNKTRKLIQNNLFFAIKVIIL
jgi:hypothetical protein